MSNKNTIGKRFIPIDVSFFKASQGTRPKTPAPYWATLRFTDVKGEVASSTTKVIRLIDTSIRYLMRQAEYPLELSLQ